MGILLERLARKKLLVSDGAWGTMLQAAGLSGGERQRLAIGYHTTSPEGPSGSRKAMTAVRRELQRRSQADPARRLRSPHADAPAGHRSPTTHGRPTPTTAPSPTTRR